MGGYVGCPPRPNQTHLIGSYFFVVPVATDDEDHGKYKTHQEQALAGDGPGATTCRVARPREVARRTRRLARFLYYKQLRNKLPLISPKFWKLEVGLKADTSKVQVLRCVRIPLKHIQGFNIEPNLQVTHTHCPTHALHMPARKARHSGVRRRGGAERPAARGSRTLVRGKNPPDSSSIN
eukprot:5962729-Pleurochrysis_carterae.AAC.3